MLLNRLELQGFKSFTDKVAFDLSHSVTAVVGPNGAGKSNITDAIRWLLGERDARNLRGGKVEDLIFAGNEKRPRLGLAQATLHFDNSSHFFPVDFKEVSISRRIGRDGSSQFFINKSEVRLKDLIDFLAKARLGARGLAVVNQGESDVFIKANPVERRLMIEEILGLKEYQLKKVEAIRRLQNTTFNLLKAKALIEELRPHLRSLKRQVSRYEGRELILGELQDLENKFYGGRLKRLNQELKALVTEENKIKEAVKVQQEIFNKQEAEFRKVSQSEPRATETLKTIQTKRQSILPHRSQLERELGKLEAQLELGQKKQLVTKNVDWRNTLQDIKRIAEPLIEENDIRRLRAGLKQITELIERLFKSGESQVRKNDKDIPKESFNKLSADLVKLDKELEALWDEEEKGRKLLQGFNQEFREAYELVESKKKALDKLLEDQNRVFLAKERVDLRLANLKEELGQIGLRIERLLKTSGELKGISEEEALKRMFKLRSELAGIGEIDESILREAKETDERYQFLNSQTTDLEKAVADLKSLIKELDYKIYKEFSTAVKAINEEFTKLIRLMFGGGRAKLLLQNNISIPTEQTQVINNDAHSNENLSNSGEAGIEIELALPKKRVKSLEVLSGGEKSLVSIAALFALISVSPPPFLVLDEIDATLDESNARRFSQVLKDFSPKTQFVIVTHNRVTMEAAQVLYGVTMSSDGTSKVVSLKLT